MNSPSSSAMGMFFLSLTLLPPQGNAVSHQCLSPRQLLPLLPKLSKVWGPGHRWAGDKDAPQHGSF